MIGLIKHIKNKKFPCVMAKAVAKAGLLQIVEVNSDKSNLENVLKIRKQLETFLENYRLNPERLSSFILNFKNSKMNFDEFESYFWELLWLLRSQDNKEYEYDRKVSSDPMSKDFSFSLNNEAFFILMLHPASPRLSRRAQPAIVFNPHQQFEKLRKNGKFLRIRNLIRRRDKALQGSINPMLNDFGESSEILQYTGRQYTNLEEIPLVNRMLENGKIQNREKKWERLNTSKRPKIKIDRYRGTTSFRPLLRA